MDDDRLPLLMLSDLEERLVNDLIKEVFNLDPVTKELQNISAALPESPNLLESVMEEWHETIIRISTQSAIF